MLDCDTEFIEALGNAFAIELVFKQVCRKCVKNEWEVHLLVRRMITRGRGALYEIQCI